MDNHVKIFVTIGALFGALGVIAGAFGGHGLESRLDSELLETYHTAVRYQMYHVFAVLFAAWAHTKLDTRLTRAAGWAFLTGIVLFSGSLYALSLGGWHFPGIITPFGGLAFIAGWIMLALAPFRHRTEQI